MMASSKCIQLLENSRCLLHQCIRWNRKYRKFNTVMVLNKHGIENRLSKPSGRRIVMRKILMEQKFIAWGHDNFSDNSKRRLNFPL
ncbi:hypothetical protein T02_15016, partial [Trichinella nativa]